MNVLLIGNYEPDSQFSMLGFARALHEGFTARGVSCRLIAPAVIAGRNRSGQSGLGKWLGYIDKFALFPVQLKRALTWADIVHVCDHGNAMYVDHLQDQPHVVTCHDMLAVQASLGKIAGWETGKTGRFFQRLICRGLGRTQSVVCVSEATRQDLLRFADVPPTRSSVVYNGLYRPCLPMSDVDSAPLLAQVGLAMQQPFLLHVGGNQPYKNRLGLLKIFHAFSDNPQYRAWKLVMAGKPLTATLRDYIAKHELGDRVFDRPGLSDDSLRALYSQARALIFPSLFEGFGLPIIEAQSCGCPVFTSDRAPMTEAGGDAAVYFDPENPAGAAQIIAEGLERLPAMRQAGFENVRRFTTDHMLDGYFQAYHQALGATKTEKQAAVRV